MDPYDNAWSFPTQRLQVRLEPDQQQRDNIGRIERVPRFTDHWQTRPMYTAVQPHSGGVAWTEHSSPSLNSLDQDGKPFNSEEEEEDHELARKKRELQELHEQIMHKKTTIAIKAIEMIVKKPDSSDDQELDTYNPESLRDRVTEILQQRSFSFFSKVKLCLLKAKAAALRKEEVKQQHHPLKLRVKALKAHRLRDPGVLPPNREKILDVPPPLTTRAVASPAKEESNAAKGFERFLNVLNRGTDVNLKNMLSDDPLPPPDHIITSPAKQQQEESTTNKGYEHLLNALKTAAAAVPNLKKTGPDVPLLPPGRSIASSERQESTTSKGYERLLSVLNKGAAPNLNTTIPDISLNPPSHSDLYRTKEESSTKRSPEGKSRASRGSEHTGRHSESKSKADRHSDHEKSESKHCDHEKSVNKCSDHKTSPKRGNEVKTGDSRASDHKKSDDGGSDLESTISRRSEVKRRSSDCKDVADRGSKNANNLYRPPVKSSANQGSGIENILDRSSETKRRVSKGSVDQLLESQGTLKRNFEPDSDANRGSGHENSGDRASESESGVSKTLKSESEKNRGLKSKSSGSKGFERFVSLLNSGVDITKLSKMIKDEVDDLPKTSPSGLKKAPKSENQKSDTGFSLPGCSGISTMKSKTVNQETSSPEDAEVRKVKKRRGLDSSSQPEPALEVKKKKEEEKETSEIDEKQKQVESILKTLGLNLDVKELTKLSDRTQERLYGRKNDGRDTSESRMEQGSQPTLGHRKHSRSRSSSSSSSSSSYSSSSSSTFSGYASRSRSRSPLGQWHRRSRSRDAHRRSRDRDRDGGKRHSRTEASKDAQRPSYRNEQHPFHSPYGAPSAYTDYSLYQYAQYMNYYNAYNSAINSSWLFDPNQSNVPLSRSQWHSVLADMRLPNQLGQISLHDFMLFMNPDLSGSEGQSNEPSGSRCLTVINTTPSVPSSMTGCQWNQLGLKEKNHKKNKRKRSKTSTVDFSQKRTIEKSTEKKPETLTAEKEASKTVSMEKNPPETVAMKEKIAKMVAIEKKVAETVAVEKKVAETAAVEKKVADTVAMDKRVTGKETINSKTLNSTPSKGKTPADTAKAMEEKRRLLTEEEIKANLREKLLEFNRKARLVTQPSSTIKPSADSLDSELL